MPAILRAARTRGTGRASAGEFSRSTAMPEPIPVTLQDSGEHSLLFLTLLEKQLQRDGPALARFLPVGQKVRRYCGNLALGGTGEILIFC